MINFGDIKRFSRISRTRKGEAKEAERASDLPLDHRLTFSPAPDEKWTYEENHIFLNNEDVREIVGKNGNDVRTLTGVSSGLNEYQNHVWERGGKGHASFNGTVAALQHAIIGRLGNLYDGLTGGVHFECVGDDFWINNVNIRSVLKLYCLRPTEPARRYLEGLRDKLGLILSRQKNSSRYDAVHEPAAKLIKEISMVLDAIPASGPPRLCA